MCASVINARFARQNERLGDLEKALEYLDKSFNAQKDYRDYYEKNYDFPKAKLIHGRHKDTTFVYRIEEMAQRENAAQALTFTELKNAIEREKLKGF